jgi:hypothetical protein
MAVPHMPYCKSTRVDFDVVFMCMMHGPHINAYSVEDAAYPYTYTKCGHCTATTDCKTNFGSTSATPSAQNMGTVLLPLIERILEIPVLQQYCRTY